MKPEKLWSLSQRLNRRGARTLARFVKLVNYVVFRAILPPQAESGDGLRLGHLGMGVVIHPNVRIGSGVTVWHNVTISATTWVGSDVRVVIGDGVTIGAGSIIVGRFERSLSIGDGAVIGAGSVVTGDVAAGAVVAGNPARQIR